MKKTMFKRIFAGIAAVFTLGLCVPTGFTNIITQPSFEAVARGEWLDMYGIEYKIKDRDTLIINENSDASIELSDSYFKSYAADIKHLQIGKGWKINSFSYLTAIESLTIGDNCTIGANSFWKCTSLTSVKIGEGCNIEYEKFEDCIALESVIIGDECNIGERAFLECTSLTSVKIGEGCDIGRSAFEDCATLTSVEIGDNCNIGEEAFYGCSALTSVKIGDNCSIKAEVFYGCSALESVTIGNSCTVNTHAFLNCTSLTNVAFGYSCTIRRWAFDYYNSIQKVFCKGSKNTVTVDDNNPEIICNKDKWLTATKCPKCQGPVIDYICEFCGYFDKAAVEAEIKANEERNAYLKSLLNEQETQSENESDNNTASTISTGNPLILLFGGIAVIIGSVAAAIIVKRMKKAE